MAFDSTKGFEPKKAIERWKKDKPLLLQDTGVSGILATLPEGPAAEQLSKYVEVQGKLKAQLSDPKIKKEPKAVKCIQSIIDDISAFLKWYKDGRNHVIRRMTAVWNQAKICQTILEGAQGDASKVATAYGDVTKVGTQNKVDLGEFPPSGKYVFPQTICVAWMQTYTTWGDSVRHLIKHLSSKPAPDPKGKEAVEFTKTCKLNVERLGHVIGLLKPL